MDTRPVGWRVRCLPDSELDRFLHHADPPLLRALRDLVPTPRPVEDVRTVVATARIEHRRRKARRDAEVLDRLVGELVGGDAR